MGKKIGADNLDKTSKVSATKKIIFMFPTQNFQFYSHCTFFMLEPFDHAG